MLIAGLYGALLVVAADISAVDRAAAGAAAGTVEAVQAAGDFATKAAVGGAAVAGDAVRPVATIDQAAESPLITLSIAAGGLGLFGLYRGLRLVRRPRPVPARPIARRIQTLT